MDIYIDAARGYMKRCHEALAVALEKAIWDDYTPEERKENAFSSFRAKDNANWWCSYHKIKQVDLDGHMHGCPRGCWCDKADEYRAYWEKEVWDGTSKKQST